MVMLSWLREQSSNFNVFVSNRVSRIQRLTNLMTWHYVPSSLNPSDILSRGASPEELLNSRLWKNGLQFLQQQPIKWPEQMSFISELPERRHTVLISSTVVDLTLNCKFYNSFSKMQRIFAFIYRFINLKSTPKPTSEQLSVHEIKMGTYYLLRNIQFIHFVNEYKALKAGQNVHNSSKLYSLAPIVDSFGLIRVGGRLQNSFLNFDAKHPIILPKCHPITISIISYYHQKFLQAGPQCLLANIRQQYWPQSSKQCCFKMHPLFSP